jgi:protocatechuate 3,4-dioxygenase beta subunit
VDANQPRDAAPEKTQPLVGVIVDVNDVPVPNAAVSILFGQIERQATHTDAAGRFRFADLPEAAMVELVVRKAGKATIHATATAASDAAEDAEVRLLLPAEAKIAGAVVEQGTGQPIAGVKLALTGGKDGPAETRESATSNAEGTFSLFALTAGPYILSLASTADGPTQWVAPPIAVMLRTGEAVTGLRIEVSRGGLVEIAVTDAGSGRPLAQARVGARLLLKTWGGVHPRASEELFAAVSDVQGVAHLRLRSGTYQVVGVSCDGYSPAGFGGTVVVAEGGTAQAALTFVPNVRGVVRDPQGSPVAGAQVKIVPGGRAEVTSDDQGQFEIAWEGANQPYRKPAFRLVARHEQRNLAAIVEIGKEANLLEVKLAPCVALTGRIVDPNGRGLGRAWVYVTLDVPDWGDTPLREEHTQADDNGKFEIPALAAGGRYAIHASADAHGSKAVAVEVGAAASRSLDLGAIALPAANLLVSGRIVDLRSRPVAGATVYGYGQGQPARLTAQTDAEGKFTLAGVCAGRIDLRVDPSGRGQRLWAQVSAPGDAVGVEVVAR